MYDEFEDIFGPSTAPNSLASPAPPQPVKRGPGRPTKEEARRRAEEAERREAAEIERAERDAPVSLKTADLNTVVAGVSIPFLMQVFRKGRDGVEMALRGVEPVRIGNNGTRHYDLVEAAEVLVKPKIDVSRYLKTLRPEDLPDQLKDSFWAAKLKEQTWRAKAKQLWPTPAVLEILNETFKTIKSETNLWLQTVESETEITEKQRATIQALLDDLMKGIYAGLIRQAGQSQTYSQNAEIPEDV